MNTQAWRFNPGDVAYVRGWPSDETAKVTAWIQKHPFPHYLVVDSVGIEWKVAQVELSSKPIPL